MPKPLGVYAASLTPFGDRSALALSKTPAYVEFLLQRGVDGLLVLGTNGEFASMTVAERQAALEAFIDAVAGRVPVVVNIGATAKKDVIELAHHARRNDADGAALLPPYYYPLSAGGFLEWIEAAAAEFEKPLYLYNIPRYTGYKIPVEIVTESMQRGVVRGMKDSSQDIAYLREVRDKAPDAELFIGSDTVLVEGLEAGADGIVSGMANTYPDLIRLVYEAFREASAALPSWRDRLLGLRNLFAKYPYLAATRHALKLRGLDLGPPRSPLVELSETDARAVERALESLHNLLASVDHAD